VLAPVAIPGHHPADGRFVQGHQWQVAVEVAVAKDVGCAALDERNARGKDDAGETGERPLNRAADAVAVLEVVAHDYLRRHGRQAPPQRGRKTSEDNRTPSRMVAFRSYRTRIARVGWEPSTLTTPQTTRTPRWNTAATRHRFWGSSSGSPSSTSRSACLPG